MEFAWNQLKQFMNSRNCIEIYRNWRGRVDANSCRTFRKICRNRAVRHVVLSLVVSANSNCDWLEIITWFILADHSCSLQKQMKIEQHVERLYCREICRNDRSYKAPVEGLRGELVLFDEELTSRSYINFPATFWRPLSKCCCQQTVKTAEADSKHSRD